MSDTVNKNDFLITILNLSYIGYITIIYFLLAIVSSPLINKILGTFDSLAEQAKSNTQIIFEIILRVGLLNVIGYILGYYVMKVVPLIPFPLDGLNGFTHSRLKEVISGAVFASYIVTFDTTLLSKLNLLRSRFSI
jgi:hypothetical protein